jgi:hypothetical protein
LAELVIALAIGVVAAGVLVLVGPLSWARLFPGIARSAARHAERFSPRLARWYDLEADTTESSDPPGPLHG